jgi:hypothetical protein
LHSKRHFSINVVDSFTRVFRYRMNNSIILQKMCLVYGFCKAKPYHLRSRKHTEPSHTHI